MISIVKKTTAVGLLCLLATLIVCGEKNTADEPLGLNQKGREAYLRLLNATVFRMGPVGFAAQISPEEKALRTLLDSDAAVEVLKRLSERATTAGRLYAALGLKVRDRNAFEQVRPFLFPSEPPDVSRTASDPVDKNVATQSGCIVSFEQRESLLLQIERGVYDIHLQQARVDPSIPARTR